jgi:hypothetical protein
MDNEVLTDDLLTDDLLTGIEIRRLVTAVVVGLIATLRWSDRQRQTLAAPAASAGR